MYKDLLVLYESRTAPRVLALLLQTKKMYPTGLALINVVAAVAISRLCVAGAAPRYYRYCWCCQGLIWYLDLRFFFEFFFEEASRQSF